MRLTIILFISLFALQPWVCFARPTPPLERVISVQVRNERLSTVLSTISRLGAFNFSYPSGVLKEDRIVTIQETNSTVREILNGLFKGTITYTSRGNHIILHAAAVPQPTVEVPKYFYLEGYISDEKTNQKVKQVTVYEPSTLSASISDSYGFYRIKVPTAVPSLKLEVRKQNYLSETIKIKSRQSHTLNIRLMPFSGETLLQPTPIRQLADTTNRPTIATPVMLASADTVPLYMPKTSFWQKSKTDITAWFQSTTSAIHESNLSQDTLHREIQVSLIPFIGTNGTLSARVINEWSVNILAGYSLGVSKFELGGFLNGVQGSVDGIQLSGFGNVVGKSVSGVQAAGFANVVRDHLRGTQIAGFSNVIGGDVYGLQAAGFANVTMGELPQGVQLAGVANVLLKKGRGSQLAGALNLAKEGLDGVQIAGIGNVQLQEGAGFQLAGAFNIAEGMHTGTQLAGVFNYAQHLNGGHQIGVINIAGYSEKAPFGLFSWVQTNGYRRLEFSTDEVNLANVTFKTGHRHFYNVFTGGSSFSTKTRPDWSFGYGLGTAATLGRGWMLSLDLTANYRLPAAWKTFDEGSYWYRAQLEIEKKLTRGLALAVGPTFNWAISNYSTEAIPRRFGIAGNTGQYASSQQFYNLWFGIHAGIRICNVK